MSQIDIATLTVLLQANAAQFQQQMASARSTAQREAHEMSRAMRESSLESRESMALLGESIGVRLPRELRRVIAETSLIGPAFALAFKASIIAAVAAEVINLIPKIRALADEIGGFGVAEQEAYKKQLALNADLVKSSEERKKILREIDLVGLQGSQRDAQIKKQQKQDLDDVNALIAKQTVELEKQAAIASKTQTLTILSGPRGFGPSRTEVVPTPAARIAKDEVTNLSASIAKLGAQQSILQAQLAKTGTEFSNSIGNEGKAAFDKAQRATEEYANKFRATFDRLQNIIFGANSNEFEQIDNERAKSLRDISESVVAFTARNATDRKRIEKEAADAIVATEQDAANKREEAYKKLQDTITATLSKEGSFKIKIPTPQLPTLNTAGFDLTPQAVSNLTGNIADFGKTAVDAFLSTRTQAELFTIQSQALLKLWGPDGLGGKMPQAAQILQRELDKINPRFQKMQELGQEAARDIVTGLEQAIVTGGNFRQILAGILEDLGRILLEAVLNPFEKSLGNIFTKGLNALTGGFSGKAGGGSVSAGTPYIVGERGPELMVPSSSGTIVPNGAMGGSVTNLYIDARGADAGVEQRVMRAIDLSRRQAVRESVVTVREQSLRST